MPRENPVYFLREKVERGYIHPDQAFQNELRIAQPNHVWVDLGCGTNRFVEEYSSNFGLAFGIDPESGLKMRAVRPFVLTGAEEYPISSDSIDLATMFMVAEHLAQPARTMQEVLRILKPGGRFLCCTVHKYFWSCLLNRILGERIKNAVVGAVFGQSHEDVFPATYQFNDSTRVESVLTAVGFEEIEINEYVEYYHFNRPVFRLQHFLHHRTPLGKGPLMKSHLLVSATKPC